MEPRTFYYSKITGIWKLLVCFLAIVLAGYVLIDKDIEDNLKVLAGVAVLVSLLFGIATLVTQMMPAINKTPALIIDMNGITFPHGKYLISWQNLESVEVIQLFRQEPYIQLNVKDIQAVLRRRVLSALGRSPKWHKGKIFSIHPADLAGEEDIFEIIREFYRHYGPNPAAVMFHRPGRETWPSEG